MRLFISFSARQTGNCAEIARYLSAEGDQVVHYASLHAQGCANCAYECFAGECPYQADGVYALYQAMTQAEQTVLLVPMYGGHPSSLYFSFCERGQGFFTDEAAWDTGIRRLYIIGIYGSAAETPDFGPCLEKWFADSPYTGRVLGLERHVYGQKMQDLLLDVPDVRQRLTAFLKSKSG